MSLTKIVRKGFQTENNICYTDSTYMCIYIYVYRSIWIYIHTHKILKTNKISLQYLNSRQQVLRNANVISPKMNVKMNKLDGRKAVWHNLGIPPWWHERNVESEVTRQCMDKKRKGVCILLYYIFIKKLLPVWQCDSVCKGT